ncbi:MBL fold metallo-hydrolase [Halobaculum gomorrense]|uniref:Putative mRNA 3-end processing factor n=1 Tax=Halobaculum gomorrense TaxID=43928 RepID=A0A1M5Q628_9EURY|nr:MBL fold metallo-hydrolase [Halobaculum gomorrense]SHH09422.1 putative mRNA 3-end processing factor [Halobaculum gomorrense]
MEIQFLGGAREVGRSAVLVDDALLLDYGTLTGEPPQYPVGRPEPDAVVVSHGHLDHVGQVPALLRGDRRPPIHWTPPTAELARVLAEDSLKLRGYECTFTESHVQRLGEVEERHGYGEPFVVEAGGTDYEVTFFDAGHIPGSAHVLVDSGGRSPPGSRAESDDGDTRLLYTADFHTDDTRLLSGSTARPDADVVICESTYSDVTHEDRSRVEERFVETVRTTRYEGATALIPAFAIGRTQEVLTVLEDTEIRPYLDGMGQRVTDIVRRHPGYVRNADALRRAKSGARYVTGRDGQRERIAADNEAVVTTSGMLSGGPVLRYLSMLRSDPTNRVCLTGYQVEGTNGRRLLERGNCELDGGVVPVAARVDLFDFSAHADRDGLRSFLDDYRGATVLVNHGDRCPAFAEELRGDGYDASAPELGERVTV